MAVIPPDDWDDIFGDYADDNTEDKIKLKPKEDIREKFKKRKKEKIDFVLPVSAIEYNRQSMYGRPPQRYLLGNTGNIINIEQGLKHEEYIITFIIDSGIIDGLLYSKGGLSLSLPKQRSRYAFYGMIKELCKDIVVFTGLTDYSSLRTGRINEYPAKSLYLVFQEEKEKYVKQIKKDKDKDRLMVRKLIF